MRPLSGVQSRSGQDAGALLRCPDTPPTMRTSLIESVTRAGLIALASGALATAQEETPKDPEPKAGEAPAAAADQSAPDAGTAASTPTDPAAAKNDSSYALGYRTGGGFAQEFGKFGVKLEDLDMDTFVNGFTAAVKGDGPELEEARLQAAMESLGNMLQSREKEASDANLAAGKKFLEENAKKEGVTVLESGLQYKILKKGGDEKYIAPKEGETSEKQFMVNYKGTLTDGTEFDASPEGTPVPMTLQVIEGFKQALTTMPVGSEWRLFIPSELAYGPERRSADIAPNSVLIFDLELVEIKDAPAAPAGGAPIPAPQGE